MSSSLKKLFKYKEKRKKVAMQRHRELLAAANANLDLTRSHMQENTNWNDLLKQRLHENEQKTSALSGQISQMQAKQDQLLSEITILRNIVTSSVDITHLPKAHGDLRLIQQAGLVLLKKLDRVCRENNLSYWMDFGSLLGTVRHKGFIPWDDDLDISMLREDYDRLLTLLDKEFTQDGYHYSTGDIIRIFYKGIPAQIDVFPYDRGPVFEPPELDSPQEQELSDLFYKINREMIRPDWSKLMTMEDTFEKERYPEVRSFYRTLYLKNQEPAPTGYLFSGIETVPPKRGFFRDDWVFPLKEAEFEGLTVHIPRNSHLYLTAYYHNYMAFPIDCYPKHPSIMGRLNAASVTDMQELIQKEAAHD